MSERNDPHTDEEYRALYAIAYGAERPADDQAFRRRLRQSAIDVVLPGSRIIDDWDTIAPALRRVLEFVVVCNDEFDVTIDVLEACNRLAPLLKEGD